MRGVGWVVVIAVALGGCGFSPNGAAPDGAHGADAPHGSDAGSGSADAGSGRGSASTGADLVLGAGRTTVGTITADIQLGAGPQLTHATAGSVTIEGHPVITP